VGQCCCSSSHHGWRDGYEKKLEFGKRYQQKNNP
jgi:hypothetical protein